MGKSKAPPPPDYAALANEQGEANIEAARLSSRLSNPNIVTPYGTRTVVFGAAGDQTPSVPIFDNDAYQAALKRYEQAQQGPGVPEGAIYDLVSKGVNRDDAIRQLGGTVPGNVQAPNVEDFYRQPAQMPGDYSQDQVTIFEQLTPEAQALFDQQMRISQQFGDVAEGGLGRVARAMGQEFDMSQLPEIQGVNTDVFNERVSPDVMVRDRVEQALLDRITPQLERARQEQEEQLLLQGQSMGGRAWQTAQQDLSRRESDALLSAILGAGQEQSRLYGMEQSELQAAQNAQQALLGAQTQARNRALQEALTMRNLPLTEINALRTGSQPVVPQFQGYQGVNVAPAQPFAAGQMDYQAQLDAVNAKNAQRGQTFGALAGLGAAGLGAAGAAGGFGNLFGMGGGTGAGASYFGGLRL